MGAEVGNGLTLESLAQRLEALERENAEFRDEVSALRGSHMPRYRDEQPTSESSEPAVEEERMSRRRMLSRAGAAVAGIVVAGALTQRDIREANAAILSGSTDQSKRGAVEGTNTSSQGYGVYGNSNGWGVYGRGSAFGVYGFTASGGAGVKGYTGSTGSARRGAVEGSNNSNSGYGVWGNSNHWGVYGTGFSAGVRGQGEFVGVSGVATFSGPSGVGVDGYGKEGGTGVSGRSTSGIGGQFAGGQAQLRLVPRDTTGPTGGFHSEGEIYLDQAGGLFLCTGETGVDGSPATWRKVTTTAV